eukprot:6482441-Amphidinium_carterae.1
MSRRFPLRQGEKLRAIDDYSESSVNAAYSSPLKLHFTDVDVLAVLLGLISDLLSGARSEVQYPDGSSQKVIVHPSWKGTQWMGTTIDLAHAYKQLAIRPGAMWTSVGGIYSPDDAAARFFVQLTLPFGAAAAVDHFNRAS